MDSSLPRDYWEWMLRALLEETSGDEWEQRWSQFIDAQGVGEYQDDPGMIAFREYLEQASDEDRESLLAIRDPAELLDRLISDRIIEPAPDEVEQGAEDEAPEAAAEEAGFDQNYDESVWVEYAQTNLVHWDGTEESWDQFWDWFVYYAAEANVGHPARQLREYASVQTIPERLATFAQYGAQIEPPVAEEAEADEAEADEAEADEAEAMELDMEDLDAALQQLLVDNPEFEDIPPERLSELMAEVLASEE